MKFESRDGRTLRQPTAGSRTVSAQAPTEAVSGAPARPVRDQPEPPTADLPPAVDPWADPTAATEAGWAYHRGVARVNPEKAARGRFAEEPSWPSASEDWSSTPSRPDLPAGLQMRQLRRGATWSVLGAAFAFLCWGIWAVSARATDLVAPVVAFATVLVVAVGVFALCRLVGRLLLERTLHRARRTARLSHLVTGAYLAAAGFGFLGQTPWVVDAWFWVSEHL